MSHPNPTTVLKAAQAHSTTPSFHHHCVGEPLPHELTAQHPSPPTGTAAQATQASWATSLLSWLHPCCPVLKALAVATEAMNGAIVEQEPVGCTLTPHRPDAVQLVACALIYSKVFYMAFCGICIASSKNSMERSD